MVLLVSESDSLQQAALLTGSYTNIIAYVDFIFIRWQVCHQPASNQDPDDTLASMAVHPFIHPVKGQMLQWQMVISYHWNVQCTWGRFNDLLSYQIMIRLSYDKSCVHHLWLLMLLTYIDIHVGTSVSIHIYTQCAESKWVAQCVQEYHVQDWLLSPSLSWKDCGHHKDEDHAQSCNELENYDMTYIPMVMVHFVRLNQFQTIPSWDFEFNAKWP